MRPVLIIGGGIGGLAAAVALRRVGIDAQVYERADSIREVGAGFTIWTNAIIALRRIGLDREIVARGAVLRRISTLSPSGTIIARQHLSSLYAACGAPSICIVRSDLQRALLGALDPASIHTGKRCVGISQEKEGVTVRFADGSSASGTVAVGADGLFSAVRGALHGPEEVRHAGYDCYRALAEADDLPADEAFFGMYPGAQYGFFPIGHAGLVYWFLCLNRHGGRALADEEYGTVVTSFGARLPRGLRRIVEGTPMDRVVTSEVVDRPTIASWTEGRVTLLGDAAHPMTPDLGQGAGMAIEDAIVLAHALRHADDPADGLAAYERRRRQRTSTMVRDSRRIGRIYQLENRLLVGMRTLFFRLPLAGPLGRAALRAQFRWEVPELGDEE